MTLAEVGGHNFLVPEVCLMYSARCITDAHFTHRGATYRKCLWLSLKARSMLLQILLKRKDSMALKHSRELRLLVINSGLSPVDNFRALQMQVRHLIEVINSQVTLQMTRAHRCVKWE